MAKINVVTQVVVPNGPKMDLTQNIEVEALTQIDVTIPAGETDMEVQLQPGGAGVVQFLLINSDWFDEELSYKVNDAAADGRALDQPHIFVGVGAVSFVEEGEPASLFFSNASVGDEARDAKVSILIGRDATP